MHWRARALYYYWCRLESTTTTSYLLWSTVGRGGNELASLRLAHATSRARLGSVRFGLVEPTSLAINVNLLSKL
jgi:hypothetical protein